MRTSTQPHTRALSFVFAAAAAVMAIAPPARAQGPYIQENFGNLSGFNLPTGWFRSFIGTTNWFPSSGGIHACSLPARGGSSLWCNDELIQGPNCGITNNTSIFSPPFPVVPGEDLRVRFDYIIDLDIAAGDRAVLRLNVPSPQAPPVVLLDSTELNLIQTGPVWQTGFEFVIPASSLLGFQTLGSTRIEFFTKVTAPSALFKGWGIDNLLVEPITVSAFCFGDDPFVHQCPCGNQGGVGEGCMNEAGSGAVLDASGTLSIATANLVMTGTGLVPNAVGVFFQGTTRHASPVLLGNGLLCIGGGITRLQIVTADVLGSTSSSVDIAAAGGVSAGQTIFYQLHYRENPGTSPCSGSSNLTNAIEATWGP